MAAVGVGERHPALEIMSRRRLIVNIGPIALHKNLEMSISAYESAVA